MGDKYINMANKRIGEKNYNNQGELMTIINYKDAFDMIVLFEKTKTTKQCSYSRFKSGKVKDVFLPTISGVGFLGDIKVNKEDRKKEGAYRIWIGMIKRCYDKTRYEKYKTYNDCYVCDEWHCYANFKKWYDKNYYKIEDEEMCIDKDILIKGNKIYSPETCIFVSQRINKLFITSKQSRGKYPIGVSYSKVMNLFEARVRNNGKSQVIAYRYSPDEAFYLYKKAKEQIIKDVAEEYKNKIPQKLYDAMLSYNIEIND